jgi:hypothetical protein
MLAQHDSLFLALCAIIILASIQLNLSGDVVPSALLLGTTILALLIHIIGVTLRATLTVACQLVLATVCASLTLLSVLAGWNAQAEYFVWGLTGLPVLLVQFVGLFAQYCSEKSPSELP